MNFYFRALVMILIFTGSIFCKVWIYSQSQVEFKMAQSTIVKKDVAHDRCLNRLFKSKRRLEDYGFVQKAMSPLAPELFYPTVAILSADMQMKPPLTEVYSVPRPPRISSSL